MNYLMICNCKLGFCRVLDASTYEKLHRVLVTYLQKAALFLVAERKYFDANLVRSFSMASLVRNVDSLLHGQTFKVRCI